MKAQSYFIIAGITVGFFLPCFAEMSSNNYSIAVSVISGGGSPMSSSSFQSNNTLGQPSPITPTSSDSFEAYPGFWHTFAQPFCPWDLEPAYPNGDGDVDGLDVHAFIESHDPATHLGDFANEFGKTDCSE